MLFERYSGKMKFVCLRYLRNDADAEDALQEGFIRLFHAIDQFEGKGAFEGWMRRIFVNSALMVIRKKKGMKEDVFDSELDEKHLAEDPDEIKEGVEAAEINHDKPDFSIIEKADLTEEELLSCIANLKQGYKVVFNLFFIDHFKHADIAKMLNIGEETSRKRLARAKTMIQKELYKLSIKKVAV